MSTTYLINEIYPCLQGEGQNLGKPSVLVRFQICNLRCKWCDTPYTHTFKSDPVDPNNKSGKQNFYRTTSEALTKEIMSHNISNIIFTGGEPTLQNIGELARNIRKKHKKYTFEVETNGTKIPHKDVNGFLESDYKLFQWNVSPKFGSSGEIIKEESLTFWSQKAKKQKNIYFKFVISFDDQKNDTKEVVDIINKYKIPRQQVFFMAEGTSQESQNSVVWLHDLCLQEQVRYTPRLHVILFGHKRGV